MKNIIKVDIKLELGESELILKTRRELFRATKPETIIELKSSIMNISLVCEKVGKLIPILIFLKWRLYWQKYGKKRREL